MVVYLLDTCIWDYWFNPRRKEYTCVNKHVEQLREDDTLALSIITWGEIFYGYANIRSDPSSRESEFLRFVRSKCPQTFDIDIHTAKKYGELRVMLFEKFTPNNEKKYKWPEQCIDPATSRELGIQENDLWITAQAMTRNLVLVTNDKLNRIQEVTGSDLRTENWAK